MPAGNPDRPFTLPAGWLDAEPAPDRTLNPGFLVLLTALAAVLRLFRLNGQSLWVDEIFTWIATRPDAGLSFFEQMLDSGS